MEIVQPNIQGMACASCISHVEKGVSGIEMAAVNLATEKATVSYDPETTTVEDIIKSVSDAGYTAIPGRGVRGEIAGDNRRTAGAAMAFGSVVMVSNSLSLKRFKIYPHKRKHKRSPI